MIDEQICASILEIRLAFKKLQHILIGTPFEEHLNEDFLKEQILCFLKEKYIEQKIESMNDSDKNLILDVIKSSIGFSENTDLNSIYKTNESKLAYIKNDSNSSSLASKVSKITLQEQPKNISIQMPHNIQNELKTPVNNNNYNSISLANKVSITNYNLQEQPQNTSENSLNIQKEPNSGNGIS